MLTQPVLTGAETTQILDAARAEAEKNKWAVTIVVADDGGHPLAMLRLDGCAPIGAYITTENAPTAAPGRRESKQYEEMIGAVGVSGVSGSGRAGGRRSTTQPGLPT